MRHGQPGARPLGGLTPAEVATLLDGFGQEWWICGGWALDVWLGRQTRPHADLDVGIYRDGIDALRAHLAGWRVDLAHRSALTSLAAEAVVPVHVTSLWCRRPSTTAWDVQVMIEERDAGSWHFRRDAGIRRPVDEITFRTVAGIPALRPEVQLPYKAKDVRPHDQDDFDAVVPTLDAGAKEWLSQAIAVVHPGHPWLDHLGGSSG